MQTAVVESVNRGVPSIPEGPKTAALKDPKYDFRAMKTFAKWKPTNGQGGALARLKEGLEGSSQQIKGAVKMFLQASPMAKGVMLEMLAEIKIHTSAIFVMEISLYYDEILCKTGGNLPRTKEVKESCWALVMKLLRTIIREVYKVQQFTAEAVSFGKDSLLANRMFLYVGMEELRVLREFASCNWHNQPKFNQNIVRHLFETCLPRAVYESRTKEGSGSHILKLNAQKETAKRQQGVLNRITMGIGEIWAKIGLPLPRGPRRALLARRRLIDRGSPLSQ
jgi:hypothetical protein